MHQDSSWRKSKGCPHSNLFAKRGFCVSILEMSSMRSTKELIRKIVRQYIKLFPEEFETFKQGMEAVRAVTRNDFATLQGTSYSRALYEMPETLATMLLTGLNEEEMVWLKAGGMNGKEGGLWFARTFKDFCIPEKI